MDTKQHCRPERPGAGSSCRVAVVSSSPLVADALGRLISGFEGFTGTALLASGRHWSDGHGAPPDVVLLEVPARGTARAMAVGVRPTWTASRTLLFVWKPGPWCDRVASELGAVGWLSAATREDQLAEALASVHRTGRLPDHFGDYTPGPASATEGASSLMSVLTNREAEVLSLLRGGLQAEEMAARLRISPRTIRTHIQNLMGKLGAHTRLEAVAVAYRSETSGATGADLRGGTAASSSSSTAGRRQPGTGWE